MLKCTECSNVFDKPVVSEVLNQITEGCPSCNSNSFVEHNEDEDKTFHRKLVRDKVLNRLRDQKIKYEATKITDKNQMHILLLETLFEDVEMIKNSFSFEGLGDILETIIALAGINKLAFEDLMNVRRKKFDKLGGYQHGCYLIWTKDEKK